jgi:hypothetical protein
MGSILRRKIYRRGGSVETTIPAPLLFSLDDSKKYEAVFEYDKKPGKWLLSFEEIKVAAKSKKR